MDSLEHAVDQTAIGSARPEPVVSVRGLVKRYGSHEAVTGHGQRAAWVAVARYRTGSSLQGINS